MLSATVPENRNGDWPTYPMAWLIDSRVTASSGTPRSQTLPPVGCNSRISTLSQVLLPHPDLPAMPIVSPG